MQLLLKRTIVGWSLLSACVAAGFVLVTPPGAMVSAAATKMDAGQIDAMVKQGVDALAAGDAKLARDTLLDVVQADTKNAQALHGLALAYLSLNDLPKAVAAIDKAVVIPGALDHAMTLNAGAIHLAAKNPIRAAKIARDYLTAKPNPLNEPVANLLAIALDRADASARKNPFYADTKNFYTSYNKRLESANPGYLRFGLEWLPAERVQEYNRTNAAQQLIVDKASKELAEIESRLAYKREQLLAMEQKVERGKALPWVADSMRYDVRNVETERDQKKQVLDEASAKLVKPAAMPETIESVAMNTTLPTAKPMAPSGLQPPVTVTSNDRTGTGGSKTAVRINSPPANPPAGNVRPVTPPAFKPPAAVTPPVEPAEPPPAEVPAEEAPPAAPKQKVTLTTYAAAFAVSPEMLITSAAAVEGASSIKLQARDGNAVSAEVVRVDAANGLALLRVKDLRLTFLNLGTPEAGKVSCLAFADANVFAPAAEQLTGTVAAPGEKWTIRLNRHPRLAGAPLMQNGKVVGVAVGDRDSEMTAYPAVTADAVKKLLGDDAPKTASTLTDPLWAMLQLSAAKEREQ